MTRRTPFTRTVKGSAFADAEFPFLIGSFKASSTGASFVLALHFHGEPKADGAEMEDAQFKRVEDLDEMCLFPPFVESIRMLLREVKPYENSDLTAGDTRGRVKDRGDFEESMHPRDESGQFASNGSGGSSSSQPTGSKSGLSPKEKDEIVRKLVGQKTHDGVEIKSVSSHAFDRIADRKMSAGRIDRMMAQGKVSPGHTEQTRCYDIEGSRMVIDTKNGNVVTIMWRGGKKHERRKEDIPPAGRGPAHVHSG